MKNLLQAFIRDCILEGTIKIPEFDDLEVFEKTRYTIDEIYHQLKIILDIKRGVENLKPSNDDNVVIPNAFKIKNYEGEDVSVDIAGYKVTPENSIRYKAYAVYVAPQTISFNFEKLEDLSSQKFREILFHELAHLKDPYLRRSKKYLSGAMNKADENFQSYASRQEEYTAQMSSYVKMFNTWLNKDPENFYLVYQLITTIMNAKDVNHLSFELIYDEESYSKLFDDQFKYWKWLEDFFHWAKSWILRPRLKKKFLKDFYKSFEPFLAKAHKHPPLPDRKIRLRK